MQCPFCSNSDTRVLESRLGDNAVRRRRECLECDNRFTTYERAVFHLTVLKKDGTTQAFDLQKITRGIERACGKVNPEFISALVQKIEQKILAKKINPLPSKEIGRLVLQELRKVDKIAYVRFASVYKSIDDPQLLKKEVSLIS